MRSAPAASRSSARRRRMAAAAEQVRDRHGQLRQHAAAHLQPDALRRGDGRRELGAPVHQRVRRRGARLATTAPIVLPGLPQFFPQANPDRTCCRNATLHRRHRAGTVASFNVDNRWPFFGFNTLWNFSGNMTKIAGSHNMKAGLFVEHTTRPAQRAVDVQRHADLQLRRIEPAQHQRRIRQRAARRHHPVPGVRRATRMRTASS